MPTVSLPKISSAKKASLEKHGLEIIESISVAAFEKAVINYLSRHNVLHLATCRDNIPRSTTVEYFNAGLTVHLLSEGGLKLVNMQANPQVSYTVAGPYDSTKDYFGAAGLQVWGTASLFRKNDDPERFAAVCAHAQLDDGLEEQGLAQQAALVNFTVTTIAPLRIHYLNYREGFRRAVWEKNVKATEA
ncbi:pyridoxamine 5'-phosphate oxidase family protein [Thermodesulfobacteriota bacterium]